MEIHAAQHYKLQQLHTLIGAERTAEDTYAKIFYEVDEAHCEPMALLRLQHIDCIHQLERLYTELAGHAPEPLTEVGPFSNDPRRSVFDIDIHFLRDYLAKAEAQLAQQLAEFAEGVGDTSLNLEDRTTAIEHLLEVSLARPVENSLPQYASA